MSIKEYLDKVKTGIGENVDETAWNKLRSQLNSGFYLGLNESELDRYATNELSYEQREVIKICSYIKLSDGFLNELAERAVNHNMPPGDMVAEMIKKIKGPEISVNDAFTNLEQLINNQTKQIEISDEERIKITNMQETIKEKDAQIASLKQDIETVKLNNNQCISKLKDEITNLRKEKNALEKKVNSIPVSDESQISKQSKPKKLFGKKKKEDQIAKEPVISEKKLFKFEVEELPEGFNLSTYMMNSDLSSSQMEIITLAVRLGINMSLIKQMVDSNLEAKQLKQILEVLLAQMEADKHTSRDMGDIDIELFDSTTN